MLCRHVWVGQFFLVFFVAQILSYKLVRAFKLDAYDSKRLPTKLISLEVLISIK